MPKDFSPTLIMLPIICEVILLIGSVCGEDYVHQPVQYHSQTDRGGYNYGYDTGLSGSHQFHQEHKDDQGTVRGRYGYTDANGKLRLVYYQSGPQTGFQIISDTESDNNRKPNAAIRRPAISPNSIDHSTGRSLNKPIYSSTYYRPKPLNTDIKPSSAVTTDKPIRLRKPRYTQTYRETGNSRLYVAGRDYGEHPTRNNRGPFVARHMHHIHHNYDNHNHNYNHQPSQPYTTPARNDIRSVFHRARPDPSSSSFSSNGINREPVLINTHHIPTVTNHDHLPEVRHSVVHTAPEVRERDHFVGTRRVPIGERHIIHDSVAHVGPAPAPVVHEYQPNGPGLGDFSNGAPIGSFEASLRATAGAPHPLLNDPSLAGPINRPLLQPPPVVYSGRGIPSPVARLRAAAARSQAIAAAREAAVENGLLRRSSS